MPDKYELMENGEYISKDDIIGEVEFFDLMKRANRDLNGHERWIIWTITKRLLRNDDE